MSLFNVFEISGSALNAQIVRMNTTSSNMANANSASRTEAAAYRAQQPLFSPMLSDSFDALSAATRGVRLDGIAESDAPARREYAPNHPLADDQGYVFMPNVNVVEEMANMISASRSYQTNIEVMEASKRMLQQTLAIGQ